MHVISVNLVIFNNLCKGLLYNEAFSTNFWVMAPRSGGGGVQCQDSRNALGGERFGSQLLPPRVNAWGGGIDLTPCVPNFGSFSFFLSFYSLTPLRKKYYFSNTISISNFLLPQTQWKFSRRNFFGKMAKKCNCVSTNTNSQILSPLGSSTKFSSVEAAQYTCYMSNSTFW